jgi:hypothetical protein
MYCKTLLSDCVCNLHRDMVFDLETLPSDTVRNLH